MVNLPADQRWGGLGAVAARSNIMRRTAVNRRINCCCCHCSAIALDRFFLLAVRAQSFIYAIVSTTTNRSSNVFPLLPVTYHVDRYRGNAGSLSCYGGARPTLYHPQHTIPYAHLPSQQTKRPLRLRDRRTDGPFVYIRTTHKLAHAHTKVSSAWLPWPRPVWSVIAST